MALIDKASLLMVPSTYEAGTLYNVLPSGNRAPDSTDQNSGYDQTRADFDFDRGSNAAATRVNASGLIEKYRENLLLQSNQFDTTWLNAATTETGGQSGYDGTNDAWLITRSFAAAYIYQTIATTDVVTLSIYAKAGSLNWFLLACNGGTGGAYFDLANGAIGTANGIDAKIESVGGGWYRCSVTSTGSMNAARIFPAQGNGDVGGSTGSIYIQNAQLESGLVSTDYLESTSVTGKAGVLVDLPRINYDANGENGALLLEPSRTNVVANSEYFEGYPQTRITLTHNAATSPEGVNNATKMVETTDTGLHFLSLNGNVTSSANAAFSIFAKQGENQFLQVLFGTGQTSPEAYANVDLSNGTYNDYNMVSFDTEDYGNGWYRIFGVINSLATSLGFYIASVQSKTATRAATYTGDGTSGFYLWGGQLESSASYPSSYIPTMGTSETRAADSCSVTGASDVIGQTEGTIYADIVTSAEGYWYLSLSDGTNSNWIFIGQDLPSFTALRAYVRGGGSTTADIYTGASAFGRHKVALAYKSNDVAFYVDGVQIGTDSSVTMPTGISNFYITSSDAEGGNQNIKGEINQLALFNERLTNEELATLTTL